MLKTLMEHSARRSMLDSLITIHSISMILLRRDSNLEDQLILKTLYTPEETIKEI
jgi:hypothetical protein